MMGTQPRNTSKRWKRTVALLPILGGLALATPAADRQVWLTQGAETKLDATARAGANQEFHLAENTGQLGIYWLEAYFADQVAPRWDVGLAYRQQYAKSSDGEWREENRPYGYATLKWKWWNQSFFDRNMVEYRRIESQNDQIRYRNKLGVEFNTRWTAWELRPYVATEIFADAQSDNLLKDRIYAGLKGHPAAWLSGDLYAMWESTDTGLGQRDNLFVAGLKLTASF